MSTSASYINSGKLREPRVKRSPACTQGSQRPSPRRSCATVSCNGGVELTASASPDEFTAYIRAEVVSNAKLARDVGIKVE